MDKLKTLPALKKIVARLKKQKKQIAFTNGCFDLLHPGHIKIFNEAKKKAEILIVGLNSDSSVRKIKGPRRPVLNQKARAEVIGALSLVDYIVVFKEETPFKTIKTIKPHLLIKGGDWPRNQIVGRNIAKKVVRVRLRKGFSTSKIIEKIIKAHS